MAVIGFEFDGHYFYVGSHSQDILSRTRKYKNVKSGNKWVALTIDDLEFVNPWKPRGIKVYGTAEIVEREGQFGRVIIYASTRKFRGAGAFKDSNWKRDSGELGRFTRA